MPDHVRSALLEELQLGHEAAVQADERDKIRIYLATEQGLTTYEIADELGVTAQTVSNWRTRGREMREKREQTRAERRGSGADGPGEREPNGS
ncbi:helix-turn-helix domain-containing protein [Streptomyces sp. NPDC087420]|uniref:helix-turn-helix domain-containing protein n=1 Tax=Streptomyces sp. NPDC087420 TaxID=3365785 RepID=UPI00383981B2